MRLRTCRINAVATALLVAGLLLAWQAQAALASSGKVTVVKVNHGGPATDTFVFTPSLTPAVGPFALADGQEQTFKVQCNASKSAVSCPRAHPVLQIAEEPTPGYLLEGIVCRHRLDDREPDATSPADPDTTVAGATIDFKVFVGEWVKCWVTNAPVPAPPTGGTDQTGTGTPGPTPGATVVAQSLPAVPQVAAPAPVPEIQVLPLRQTPGRARLQGPRACTRIPAAQATVVGRQIARVTFYVDGRRVRTLTRPDAHGRWRLHTGTPAFGTHRVRARIEFTRASGSAPQTLTTSFSRCQGSVARPQFTG
jgi:hypothetical protein